jgi:peptidyl-prolyl cis-trans isomerase SurA
MILSVLFISALVKGQDQDKVLFSVDGKDVYNTEFIRVFEKNRDIVVEEEHKDFDDYFDLFVDFKLKLEQARDIHLDTTSSYVAELAKYREQLVQPYLQNPEAIERLVKEAYSRTVTEVSASHILIIVEADAPATDTIRAYARIMEARNEILAGAQFDSIAKLYSDDPSVQLNDGELGYFSAFAMVYEFENAAYDTKIGEVSMPFRTQFGYHIVKVNDKRKSPGEVQVAHIMVKNDSANILLAKEKIDDIYNKLLQGDDFARIAQEHSDDLTSAQKGGTLPKFGTGRMIKTFEDVAFSLDEEGDFSQPFESSYGWHILKLLETYPIPSYVDLHSQLESKVKNGSRSGYVERSLAQKIALNYEVIEYKDILQLNANFSDLQNNFDTILVIENKYFTSHNLYDYGKGIKKKSKELIFEDYKNSMIIDYYKEHLEETNKEFALTYKEYRDGLLLFELLQKVIWERSEKDSLGLNQFFEAHRDSYKWKKRADLSIASCTRMEKAEIVEQYMIQGLRNDSIKALVNEGATIHVLFSKGKLEEGSSKLPETYQLELGVSKIFEEEKNNFTIIKVDTIFEPQLKELKDTRGEVMNDYQNYLEAEWVKELRKTYKIKVNNKNYKELKQRFSN